MKKIIKKKIIKVSRLKFNTISTQPNLNEHVQKLCMFC